MGEDNDVHILDPDSPPAQAECDRPLGKGPRVLLAIESLLLHERDGLAVLKKRSGRIVAPAVDSEDVHVG
jgi:hypothetical protein